MLAGRYGLGGRRGLGGCFFGRHLCRRYLSRNIQRHGVLGIRRTVLADARAAVEAVHQGTGATLRTAGLGYTTLLGCAVLHRALYSILVGVGGHARHTPTLGSRARTHERTQRTCG